MIGMPLRNRASQTMRTTPAIASSSKVEILAKLYLEGAPATLGLNPIYNFIFQAMHDNDHYRTHSEFSLEGEIATYNATAKRAPSLDIQKILYSESVLRSAAQLFLGHAPMSKIVFP